MNTTETQRSTENTSEPDEKENQAVGVRVGATPEPLTAEREKFESWGKRRQGRAYANVVEAAWDAWQARAALEGEVSGTEPRAWTQTEGGAFESGPYLVSERIDDRGWNATAMIDGEDIHILLGVSRNAAMEACESHAGGVSRTEPALTDPATFWLKHDDELRYVRRVLEAGRDMTDADRQAAIDTIHALRTMVRALVATKGQSS